MIKNNFLYLNVKILLTYLGQTCRFSGTTISRFYVQFLTKWDKKNHQLNKLLLDILSWNKTSSPSKIFILNLFILLQYIVDKMK